MPEVPKPTTRPGSRSRLTAEQWWDRARTAGDQGRPAIALRHCRRALDVLDREEQQAGRDNSTLRARILLTESYQLGELGQVDAAIAALDAAERLEPAQQAAVVSARGLLLVRSGQYDRAVAEMDRAIHLLAGRPSLDLASTLLNRGLLHMTAGRLDQAADDTSSAERVGRELGHEVLVFMARHNLGFVRYLSGDLPGALDLMATATAHAPDAARGVPSLDRARVLLSAGLFTEAGDSLGEALHTFTAHRALTDLVDALLVASELALLQGNQALARRQARRAESISRRLGHRSAALVAQLLALRAEAIGFESTAAHQVRRPTRTGLAKAAATAEFLSGELTAAGLLDDAATAELVLAEARLLAGDLAGAQRAATAAAAVTRRPSIGIRLHTRLVAARLALESGRAKDGLAQISKGLEDLAQFQSRFGSQDMQAAAAVHGGALARTGLRTAVGTGDPAVILPWLERSRAATTRLPVIRPPSDPELTSRLAQLRMQVRSAREATLAGTPDPALQRAITDERASIRARAWTASGSRGRPDRPVGLLGVQRHLREQEPASTVLAYFHGAGRIHALVVTARRAHYRVLGEREPLEHRLSRVSADLDLLAAPRMNAALRAVATRSLAAGLHELSTLLIEPIADLLGPHDADGPGRVRLAVVGRLGTAPWSMVPGLVGRPLSLTASITSAVSAAPESVPAHTRGVLAVAGPEVRGGDREVAEVGRRHPGSMMLTGSAASGGAVLANMPHGGLLHIAAHGQHVPENPLFSAVLLADGPLFAYDITPNPALPAHVVLSSCDVGQSADLPGGEPLGLAAALLRSGVRTVVAGTSRISDTVAATVMTEYHDRLLAGDDPATALAAAIGAAGDQPAPLTCFGA